MYIAMQQPEPEYKMEQFVVRKGLEAKSLADLKGKKLMSAPGPANLNTAKGVLAKVGLKDGDYTIDQLDMGQHVNAMKAGTFDGGYTLEPNATTMQKIGVATTLEAGVIAKYMLGDPERQRLRGGLRFTTDFIKSAAGRRQALRRGLGQGGRLIKNNPAEARKHLAKNTLTPDDLVDMVPMLGYFMVKDMTPKDKADYRTSPTSGEDRRVPEKIDVIEYSSSRSEPGGRWRGAVATRHCEMRPVARIRRAGRRAPHVTIRGLSKRFDKAVDLRQVRSRYSARQADLGVRAERMRQEHADQHDRRAHPAGRGRDPVRRHAAQRDQVRLRVPELSRGAVSVAARLRQHRLSAEDDEGAEGRTPARVEKLVAHLGVKLDLNRYPYEMSGGQQQLVSIMRALVVEPEILFLDEPFSALDYEMTLFMREQLQRIFMETGTTTVLVSHDLEEAVYLADYVLLLSRHPARVADFVPFDAERPRTDATLSEPDFVRSRRTASRCSSARCARHEARSILFCRSLGVVGLIALWYFAVWKQHRRSGAAAVAGRHVPKRCGRAWPAAGSASISSRRCERTVGPIAIAAVIAIPLGIFLGSSERLYRSVEFVIDFFRSTPASAMFPLFLVLFGVGDKTKISVAAFGAMLVILFNVAYGVMNARKTRLLAAKVMGASRLQVLSGVMLLESLPQTFVGLRNGVSLALVIIVVAEMFIGSPGRARAQRVRGAAAVRHAATCMRRSSPPARSAMASICCSC